MLLHSGGRVSSDLEDRSYSSIASAASFRKSSVTDNQERMGDGDRRIPKPKKRGILKTSGGASSGSDIDRRSALSSQDEKESDTKAENLALDTPDPLRATRKLSASTRKDSKEISSGHAIDKDLNDALAIKSNSTHSLGSLPSFESNSDGNDLLP